MNINSDLTLQDVLPQLNRFFELAAPKLLHLERTWPPAKGTPVFTVEGVYTTRGWTEWTQGFQFGCQLLQFDATDDPQFLALARKNIIEKMAPHVSHVGVHDHGFNNLSTYGNLRRLLLEGRVAGDQSLLHFCELALKVSGAVQANRWTRLAAEEGYIHSFNGPHSLFSDTQRTLRILAVSHQLGHVLMGENDQPVSLLARLVQHSDATLRYNVYYGEGRDLYDVPGRVAHESIFNVTNGAYRCPSTQQGYSPFSTWTRGLAWVLLGCAEQLEFFQTLTDEEVAPVTDRSAFMSRLERAARVTADFHIANSAADGVPLWDTGAPGAAALGDYQERPSDPFNDYEPVDSSAAAIAAQGFYRLGKYLDAKGDAEAAHPYHQAALTLAQTLFQEPYLSTDPAHQGLILHSLYHRPNGWDHIPPGREIPCGESSMWGDYHAMEFALLLRREALDQPYPTFFA